MAAHGVPANAPRRRYFFDTAASQQVKGQCRLGRGQAELLVQGTDSKLQTAWTFGQDPYWPG